MIKQLVYNALHTPDGTILESLHRHDFKTHMDKKTNKMYMIDGGLEYQKRSCNGDEINLSVYSDEPHERVRQFAYRSGYGKHGDQELQITKICNMDDEYLEEAIDYCVQFFPRKFLNESTHYQILINEKEYRKLNNIKI